MNSPAESFSVGEIYTESFLADKLVLRQETVVISLAESASEVRNQWQWNAHQAPVLR